MRRARRLRALILLVGLFPALTTGCSARQTANCPTPASAGVNTRDIIDVAAQAEMDRLINVQNLENVAEKVRAAVQAKAPPGRPTRNVLCLSGGGSFGAYSAGVLYGWTQRGDRPQFDVVTGISTGALAAPFAFLGPKYDEQLREFNTMLTNKDIYKSHPVRGLFGEALADNAPLARQIDKLLTPEMIAEIADAHLQGRRLYIGTTEAEGKRFIVWDIGAIASRNCAGDRELIRQILLGSSAIPGFFPPSKIDVSVDGKCFTERHVDGGTSQGIFFRPPYVPPELQNDPVASSMAGTKVWAIVAGKIFADPEVFKDRSLTTASKCVSTIIYAQTRGDLQRMFTLCLLNGMELYMTAVPAAYPAPISSTEFKPEVTCGMFEEGRRVVLAGTAWRTTPPGGLLEEGELIQGREGRCLTFVQRGPILPIHGSRGKMIEPFYPRSEQGIPAASPIR